MYIELLPCGQGCGGEPV
jgi:hypothetical protein